MGPNENPTRYGEGQAARAGKRPSRGPRTRRCLLKGCAERFRPRHARQRYCSDGCRKAARQWSEWKARQKYRVKAACKQKRSEQSRRYRERVKSRKPPKPEVVNDTARVITNEHFFRAYVRPAGMLRAICAAAAKSFAAFLFGYLSTRPGTGAGARAALETEAHLIWTY